MSTATALPVSIRILDKEYIIACPEDEQEALEKAVQYLNRKTRETQAKGAAVGSDRLLALTALNIANELLQESTTQQSHHRRLNGQLLQLQNKIEHALIKSRQMEL